MFALATIALFAVLLDSCSAIPQKYYEALKADAVCYYEPVVFLDPVPLSDAAALCTANGFTLSSIPNTGLFATAVSNILLSFNGPCSVFPQTSLVAMPSCSVFDVSSLTAYAATNCAEAFNVMCVLPAPALLTQTVTQSSTLLSATITLVQSTIVRTTSTIVFLSGTTTFILQPSFTTSIVTIPVTNTVSVVNTQSTTTTTTIETTIVLSALSQTTTSTTITNYSISQTTTSSTLTITKTLTEFTTDTTTFTSSSCPPTSFSTRTQTTTVTATVTVKTIVPTDTTTFATASTTVTTTQSVCGGHPTSTACCPPGKKCPRLPKQCLSYGQVQTCKYHDRKLLVAFRPATRDEAACVCQAVGGSLAVLSGDDDQQAAFEVVYGCVGSGGRAWIGQQLDEKNPDKNYLGIDDHDWEYESNKCHVVRAIDKAFGIVEDESCQSKYPILCRYW